MKAEELFKKYSQGFLDSFGQTWQCITKDNFAKAITEVMESQQQEIEVLKALLVCAQDDLRVVSNYLELKKSELSRLRGGVGKLHELTDNKTVPYIEGVRDAKNYLDNLIGDKK